MSSRIVVNLEHGLTESAIDRAPDGGVWLSLWRASKVVIVKLSMSSFQTLCLTLAKELAETAAPAVDHTSTLGASGPTPPATGPEPLSAPAERA